MGNCLVRRVESARIGNCEVREWKIARCEECGNETTIEVDREDFVGFVLHESILCFVCAFIPLKFDFLCNKKDRIK